MPELSPNRREKLEQSRLAQDEPEFFHLWLGHQHADDPQLDRWCEFESHQMETAQRTVDEMRDLFSVSGKRVLDLGCQWGATSIALARAGASVTGVDVRDPFILGARVRAQRWGLPIDFCTAPAEELPFADGAFEIVVCLNVIEHVRSQRRMLDEIVRVLAPGGLTYINGPNRFSPQWFLCDPHYQMFGISLLPSWLGRFYVMSLRRYPAYEVGTFPVASGIAGMLRRRGLDLVQTCGSPPPGPSANPGVRGALKRLVASARAWIRMNSRPMFWFVARKPGA